MKFISWNVNGLRAVIKKGFYDFMDSYDLNNKRKFEYRFSKKIS